MPKILTLSNCVFTCPFLTGVITVQQTPPAFKCNGSNVLTNMATLTGNGLCMKIPPAPSAPPPPCTLIMSPAWISGVEMSISSNEANLLNSDASQICPSGTKISCTLLPIPSINKETSVSKIDIPLDVSDVLSALSSSEDSSKSSETSEEAENENTEDSENNKNPLEDLPDVDNFPEIEEKKTASLKCDSATCPHRQKCEYL